MTLSKNKIKPLDSVSSQSTYSLKTDLNGKVSQPLISPNPYVFVFWGERYDAEIAVIFMNQLRSVGLNVKLVGISGMAATGQKGIILRPDMVLGEVLPLVHEALCVVLPCDVSALKRLNDDPRIASFLTEASTRGAFCVAINADALSTAGFARFGYEENQARYYGETVKAVDCARQLGAELRNHIEMK